MNALALATETGERSAVHFGRTRLEYRIQRSRRRKTVSLAVVPGEGLVVTAPAATPIPRLDAVVHEKGAWITQRLKRQSDLPPPLPAREFVSGETFRYLGRQYRLKVVRASEDAPVRLHGGYLTLTLERGLPEDVRAARARTALIVWYRARAAEYLPRRAAVWAPKLGLKVPRLIVAEPAKRWGSASKDGTVRINWRIIQVPVALLDHVVVHELVHLIHEHHGREFWALVGRVSPEYEANQRRLRQAGARLHW